MKRGRSLLVIALIVALLAAAGTQKLALNKRQKLLRTTAGTSSTSSLANMDSYALALLLGGMRGPLVMFLWMESESSKQQKDLEGVETQIEWIRLLQPEFDTVHLFQVWNKAYNISVQMASLANKYSVILDAIRYAQSVEKERPHNLNLLMSIANIYHDKLGGSAEKYYYRERIREDTKYRDPVGAERVAGARPTRHASLLQPDGMIKPELLRPTLPVAQDTPEADIYDGSELQFLKSHQPFPYGVPVQALAYNYFKRSQVLQRTTGQQHIQISPMVVDSRPALCLRLWFEVEWDLANRQQAEMFSRSLPIDRVAAIIDSVDLNPLSLTKQQIEEHREEYDRALYHLSYAIRLIDDAEVEYRMHLAVPDYQMHVDMYRSHLEHLAASRFLLTGDHAMLQAASTDDEAKKAELLNNAREAYQKAIRNYRIVRLRYYTAEQYYADLFPQGMNRWNLENATDTQLEELEKEVDRRNEVMGFDYFEDDTREHKGYIDHCLTRLSMLPNQQEAR